jgi:mono/diheme cytochrome c family protein
VIAYVKSMPPVDKVYPEIRIGPIGAFYILSDPNSVPAATIDHFAPRPPAPEPGVTVEYGKYLSIACQNCHAPNLAGFPGEGGGSNLTPGGQLAEWTEADFLRVIRTGVRPNGSHIDPELAPVFEVFDEYSDDELRAIWLYLQSVPPVESPPDA